MFSSGSNSLQMIWIVNRRPSRRNLFFAKHFFVKGNGFERAGPPEDPVRQPYVRRGDEANGISICFQRSVSVGSNSDEPIAILGRL